MKRHAHEAFCLLRVAYPRWAEQLPTQELIEAWGKLVEDLESDALLVAVRRLAATSKFAPTIAEIREAAGCIDPDTAARRSASATAAAKHDAWVAEQERIAVEEARRSLRASGIDPNKTKPGSVADLLKGIGR